MQESTMASTKEAEQGISQMMSVDKDADIRQPSINTEPRTLNEMKMERAMILAQQIFAEDPSQDFTKDALDTATRENAPAEDAGGVNPLGTNLDDLVEEAGNVVDTNSKPSPTHRKTHRKTQPFEAPTAPPATPST